MRKLFNLLFEEVSCATNGIHSFEPRYSEKTYIDKSFGNMVTTAKSLKIKNGSGPFPYVNTEKVYECDVCTRCGQIAKRGKQ